MSLNYVDPLMIALLIGVIMGAIVAVTLRLRVRQTTFRRRVGLARILESTEWREM